MEGNDWMNLLHTSIFFQIYQSENFSTSMSGTAMGEEGQQEDRKVLGNPFSTKPGGQIGFTFTHAHAQMYTLERQLSCLFSCLAHSPVTFPVGCLLPLRLFPSCPIQTMCKVWIWALCQSDVCTHFFSCSRTCSFSIS